MLTTTCHSSLTHVLIQISTCVTPLGKTNVPLWHLQDEHEEDFPGYLT